MPEPDHDRLAAPADPAHDSRVDQTELVASLVDELRASEDRAEMLTYVLGHASHDLNNPTTMIGMIAKLMLAETKPDDPAAADIQQIIGGAEMMVPILKRMIALAGRPTAGGEWCDLVEIVSEAVAQEVRTRPDLRLKVADDCLSVNLPPDRTSALVRAVLCAAQSAAPTGPIEMELRAIPRLPSNSAGLAHVRLRVTGEVSPGFLGLPWELGSEFRSGFAREGVLISQVTDGRIKIDLWLPQSRAVSAVKAGSED